MDKPPTGTRPLNAAHRALIRLLAQHAVEQFLNEETEAGTPEHPHVYMNGWISDYLGAGNFVEPQYSCGDAGFANTSGWCSEALEEQMDEALLLTITDRGAANRAWAEIDHDLVDDGALAALTNPIFTTAVSDRVENVQVHPQWGLLLSLLWVE